MRNHNGVKPKIPFSRHIIGITFFSVILVVYTFSQSNKRFLEVGVSHNNAANCEDVTLVSNNSKVYAQQTKEDSFVSLLQKTAMEDKIVILTEVNEAFAAPNSMLDLFLKSFHDGNNIEYLLSHLIIVAMDRKAFEKCKSVHPHCYMHEGLSSDLSSEKSYLSKDYLVLVWSKVRLWQFILEQGYSFLFTDVDIMWFDNPFRQISVYADLTLATDVFYGNPEDHNNMPNTGLVFAKPSQKNIEMLKYWQEARTRFPTTNEQTVYDKIKHELVSKFELKVQYVSTKYWGNFCQPQMDFSKLSTFHACCRAGLAIKLDHIKSVIEAWKIYKSQYLKY